MLAKRHRLTKKNLLEKVKTEGDLYQADSFGMVVLKQEKTGPSRFAFIVSTKISKKAVDRNKITRRLREAVKERLANILNGYDVVFLAKRKIMDKNNSEIVKEMNRILREAGLIK
ncbi:MAG: ribonuclease P protein component [Patescibacteria group bacterium]